MSSPGPTRGELKLTNSRVLLQDIASHIGHLLPAQGPISVFVHHNPLHPFEHLPFESATEQAAEAFSCAPYLTEERYREALRRGRILDSDIDAVLATAQDTTSSPTVAGGMSRREIRRRILRHGLPELRGPVLTWTLSETRVLRELRRDLPADAREALGCTPTSGSRDGEEARLVWALWSACCRAVERAEPQPGRPHPRPVRHRDLLHAMYDIDVDEWVHPLLIRVTGAYLDQGLADWSMPGRERGLFSCFLDLYRRRLARLCRPFGPELQRIVRGEAESGRDVWASLTTSLLDLGVPEAEWQPFLVAEALALRGFAGMLHQFELRPDRVPSLSLPARLVDFLAIRMLLLRASLLVAARRVGFVGPLSSFHGWLSAQFPEPIAPSVAERAWPLFHVAQLTGMSARRVDELDETSVALLEREVQDFDGVSRRRLLHQAYERNLRHRFFDALVGHRAGSARQPAYQVILCIDEREESMRRHIEEVDPEVETFGAAGFFGVAMYYRGATDARARPLCPVTIRPRHFVAEIDASGPVRLSERLRRRWQRVGAQLDRNVHLGGRHARSGALLFATVGALWVVPLVLKVIFPWLQHGVAWLYGRMHPPQGRLALEYRETDPPAATGGQTGFKTEEMAEIVLSLLRPIGIRDRFAGLVLVLGHGSTSLNNPHESAHDCGACGGGRGGPNARAFAQMANDPAVRELVATRGLRIPQETWFVGGERNTANNDLHLFDEALAPALAHPLLRRLRASLQEARRREAHERCRRFDSAAPWLPPAGALFHVQARATDLAQPRPEYGHATNAVCVIGRRRRTRGLFLDRRAFLLSYDPEGDPEGALLGELLAALVPVVTGINLEYLFGYVDPTGYGSGTKLPHNVSGLVGVMDGAQSDLRTGLPWQMLEIHEPVRLTIVIEVNTDLLRRLLQRDPKLAGLVDRRWIFMAALDPNSNALVELDSSTARHYQAERSIPLGRGGSRRYYEGRRGPLPFATIEVDHGGAV